MLSMFGLESSLMMNIVSYFQLRFPRLYGGGCVTLKVRDDQVLTMHFWILED